MLLFTPESNGHPALDLDHEIELLERLLTDLKAIRGGVGPTAADLESSSDPEQLDLGRDAGPLPRR